MVVLDNQNSDRLEKLNKYYLQCILVYSDNEWPSEYKDQSSDWFLKHLHLKVIG